MKCLVKWENSENILGQKLSDYIAKRLIRTHNWRQGRMEGTIDRWIRSPGNVNVSWDVDSISGYGEAAKGAIKAPSSLKSTKQ